MLIFDIQTKILCFPKQITNKIYFEQQFNKRQRMNSNIKPNQVVPVDSSLEQLDLTKNQRIQFYKPGKQTILDPQVKGYIETTFQRSLKSIKNNEQQDNIKAQPKLLNPTTTIALGYDQSMIIPSGVLVRVNINPISRYNFAIEQYNEPMNKIQDIELSLVPTNCFTDKIYDFIIYFYTRFFMTITCQYCGDTCGLLVTLLLLGIYVVILIMPGISVAQLILSGIFFIYYIIGVVYYNINKSRLGTHNLSENMIPASLLPFYDHDRINRYYDIENQMVIALLHTHPEYTAFQKLKVNKKARFMAYQQCFIEDKYMYIVSRRMICFHIAFMFFSIIGLVISIAAFPAIYGRSTSK